MSSSGGGEGTKEDDPASMALLPVFLPYIRYLPYMTRRNNKAAVAALLPLLRDHPLREVSHGLVPVPGYFTAALWCGG
eukprot:gene27385-biopygen10606